MCLVLIVASLFLGLLTKVVAITIALLLSSLLSPLRVLLPVTLLLCLPMYGFGSEPLFIAPLYLALVEGLRSLYKEQQQLASNRQDLLKTLVHELRNPLFAAKGTIDNLSANSTQIKQEDLELQLAMASEAMQVINQEVDDLTQLLRLESGRLVARSSQTSLNNVYRSLLHRHPPETLAKHSIDFEGGEIEGYFDPLLLVQALDKLITNAINHTESGSIRVRAARKARYMLVEVSDEGPGIPSESREKVFDRFRQMSTSSIGFGLGLYLARQYVEAQDGSLTLEDSATGCLFRIRLPALQSTAGQAGQLGERRDFS